ncbi:DUF488 domain-containing protein [Brachybacterium sp. DNPG3]
MPAPLITLGHGRLDRDELTDLLVGAGIEHLVDVRRFPGSRANEAAARGVVPALCEAAGIAYRWDERLGGRRRLTAEQDAASPDTWWRVAAFRAYAAWTRDPVFRAGIADLLTDVADVADVADDATGLTAVMCSESVWWRCHRRLIADVVLLEHGVAVEHLMPDGQRRPHEPSPGARLDAQGHTVWDGAPAR